MKKILFILLLSCPIWNVLAISGLLKQSTAVNVTVVMIDSTDHVTGKTLLTLTIRESKAGGAFATITPTVTELENGLYKLAFTTAHTDTLGELRLRVTAAGADESDPVWQVVSMMPSDTVPLITDRIDYQKGHHAATGNTFYVNGTTGNDSTGTGSRNAPYKTISKALTQCVSFNHDLIMLQPDPAGGPTTITESATIPVNVSYVQIRGPGRDVNVTQTAAANRDVFAITVSGVELSGFRITTNGNSSNGVTVSNAADFVRMSKLWIENAHQDAVQFNVANRCEVTECEIVAAGRDGVRVTSGAGSGQYTRVTHNLIRNCVGSGVNLQGSDAGFCRIQNNVIRDNGVAVTVSAGANNTTITDNRFVGNTATINDAGTGTLNQWNIFTTDANGDVTVVTNLDKTGYSLSALDSAPLESGTAQTGGANTITLRIGADVNDNTYNWEIIEIYGGLGAGQSRVISDYNGTSKIATVNVGWKTVPDNTSLYRIISSSPNFDANGKVTFNNSTIGSVSSAIVLPAIPNNWITATGIAAGALNGKGDWLLASSYVDIWNVTLPSTYTGQKAGALLWKIGNRPN